MPGSCSRSARACARPDSPGARLRRARGADEDPGEVPARARGRAVRHPPGADLRQGLPALYADALGLDGAALRRRVQLALRRRRGRRAAPCARRVPVQQRRDASRRESRIAVVALLAIAVVDGARDRRLAVRRARRASRCQGSTPQAERTTHASAGRRTLRRSSCARRRATRSWRSAPARRAGEPLYSGTLERGQTQALHAARRL